MKALREEIAAVELTAEQIEWTMLLETADRLSDSAAKATLERSGRRPHATGAAEVPSARLLIAAAIAYRLPADETP